MNNTIKPVAQDAIKKIEKLYSMTKIEICMHACI